MDITEKRKEIDEIDTYLVKLFLRRMQISGEIGEYKKENAIRVYDEKRENEIFERVKEMAPEKMQEYITLLYETVLGLSNAYQLEILNAEDESD